MPGRGLSFLMYPTGPSKAAIAAKSVSVRHGWLSVLSLSCCSRYIVTMLKVTFDTNTFNEITNPTCEGHVAICDALRARQIHGLFSEAVVVLDALLKQDKVDMVGSARIESESRESGPNSITISVGRRWPSKPIPQQFLNKLHVVRSLGMRAMIGPRRLGDSLVARGFDEGFYEPTMTHEDLIARGAKANEVDLAIAHRNVGRARAVTLGLEFSERDGHAGEYWCQGIGRARSDEGGKVRKAINEWADGEAVAAHVAYGNDLFCTEDRARSSGGQSILSQDNRNWLSQTYGVKFVTMAELAERIALGCA